jgi:DNA-binding response OmpR family regulator
MLVIEDDVDLAASVAQAVQESGFGADVAHSGPEGLRLAAGFEYSLVVLDLLLPGMHGLAVLKELRRIKPRLPILVLSALADVEERVVGLDRGADDYLAKPFALAELLARSRALLRRSSLAAPESVVTLGDITVDLVRHRVRRGGRELDLTARQYAILLFLLARRGRPVRREEIGEHVIDRNFEPSSNAIDVSICGLRAKLGDPDPIRTLRGVGYRLEDPAVA